MSFEIQLLMFAFVLPLIVSFLLTLLWKQVNQWFPHSRKTYWGLAFMMIPLISLIASSSRNNLWGLPSDDYHRKLPWVVLASGLLGIVITQPANWFSRSSRVSSKDRYFDSADTCVWLLRATLLLSLAWWLIPKGKGWEDTVAYQPLWLLLAGLGGVWCWWVLQSIRTRCTDLVVADNQSDSKTLNIGSSAWQLWIAVGALLGMAGLAAQSFASLAEGIMSLAAMGIGVVLAVHLHADKREAVWMEPILGVGLSSSATLAMAYSGSTVPIWAYPATLAVPLIVSLIDRILVLARFSLTWRVCVAATVTAVFIGGILALVLANQPEEQW